MKEGKAKVEQFNGIYQRMKKKSGLQNMWAIVYLLFTLGQKRRQALKDVGASSSIGFVLATMNERPQKGNQITGLDLIFFWRKWAN